MYMNDDYINLIKDKNEHMQMVKNTITKCIGNTENMKKFISVISTFNKLSINNCAAVYSQRPNAKHLMSVENIEKVNGRIYKGEKGIALLVPKEVEKNGEKKVYYNLKKYFDISQVSFPKEPVEVSKIMAVDVLAKDYINFTNAIKGVQQIENVYDVNINQPENNIKYDMVRNITDSFSYENDNENLTATVAAIVSARFGITATSIPDFNGVDYDTTVELLNTSRKRAEPIIANIEYELRPQLLYKNYDITYDSLAGQTDSDDEPVFNKEQLSAIKKAFDKNFNSLEISVIAYKEKPADVILAGVNAVSDGLPLPLVNSLIKHYNAHQISALRQIYSARPSNKTMSLCLNQRLSGMQLSALYNIITNDINKKIDVSMYVKLCSAKYSNEQLMALAEIIKNNDITYKHLLNIINSNFCSQNMILLKDVYLLGVDENVVDDIIKKCRGEKGNDEQNINKQLRKVMFVNKKSRISEAELSIDAVFDSAEYEAAACNAELNAVAQNKNISFKDMEGAIKKQ